MRDKIQQTMMKFIAEAKMIDGADNAIFEFSEEFENCLILTGEIYGKETNHKINELGKKNGLLILARQLIVLYEKPNGKK